MPPLINQPNIITAGGNKPKRIEEFFGQVNSKHDHISVARMVSPAGWQEPGQKPEFQEMTIVLQGYLRVEHEGGELEVKAGQAIITESGEWVRYSTPNRAEYIAVCLPAFLLNTVHRDEDAA